MESKHDRSAHLMTVLRDGRTQFAMMHGMSQLLQTDFLVIGSGIAGLSFALHAAEKGEVLIITKRQPDDGSTAWAQGGIAAVLDPLDSLAAHIEDTLTVGEGLCRKDIVEQVVTDGPQAVRELCDRWGVHFDRGASGELDLAREGGHSARRVAHAQGHHRSARSSGHCSQRSKPTHAFASWLIIWRSIY